MLENAIDENSIYNSRTFEPFMGLNIGISRKSLKFEYNRNSYRFKFMSRF